MQTYNVSRLPSMIKIGYDGENNWRPNAFDCSSLLKNHQNGIISLWLLPKGETQAFPVALERDGNTVIWTPLSEEMTAETGAFQFVCIDGTDVGKSAVVMFRVDESIIPGAEHPAAVPSWATHTIERAEEAAERAEEAADSIEGSITEKLNEVVPDAVADYMEDHPVTVEETDPTVPAWAKQPTKPTYTAQEVGALPSSYTPPVTSVNGMTGDVIVETGGGAVDSVNGKTGTVVLTASDVGALPSDTPIPAAVTEQTVSGWGFTKNTGTYSKPSTGIPKSDLASAVQTSLGKADTALQQHQSLAGYATESYVQTQIANIPDELPTVAASDNGKFLRVVNGAWAAQAVPAAESASFGGGA